MCRLLRMLGVCLVCAAVPVAAPAQRIRAVRQFPDFSRILVIAAHPDDETLLAPMLAAYCAERSSHCELLVMTRGENGACVLASGCGGDLGAIRTGEVTESAALLNLSVDVWDFPDAMADVLSQWEAHAGGPTQLLSRIERAIADASPTAILTFDPAHGSTCHPAHRAIAALVDEVARAADSPRSVYFLETRVAFDGEAVRLRRGLQFASSVFIFDASQNWHWLIDAGRLHASQFTAAQLASLQEPDQFRSILLMPASAAATARYEAACP